MTGSDTPHPLLPSAARREHRLRRPAARREHRPRCRAKHDSRGPQGRRPSRGGGGTDPGFRLRGLKGLWWEPEQYLGWPDFLADAGYDFFMLCYTFCPENGLRWRQPFRDAELSIVGRLFVFFDRSACPERSERIPPTNNASEQDLRPSVIHRRVTGGFRSQLGADVSAILTSLLTTARKRGENLFQALGTVAGPSPVDACGAPACVEARAG